MCAGSCARSSTPQPWQAARGRRMPLLDTRTEGRPALAQAKSRRRGAGCSGALIEDVHLLIIDDLRQVQLLNLPCVILDPARRAACASRAALVVCMFACIQVQVSHARERERTGDGGRAAYVATRFFTLIALMVTPYQLPSSGQYSCMPSRRFVSGCAGCQQHSSCRSGSQQGLARGTVRASKRAIRAAASATVTHDAWRTIPLRACL